MGGPEQFGLVAEPVVGVEHCSKVRHQSKQQVVLEESMDLEESSEFLKEGQYDILFGSEVQCNS